MKVLIVRLIIALILVVAAAGQSCNVCAAENVKGTAAANAATPDASASNIVTAGQKARLNSIYHKHMSLLDPMLKKYGTEIMDVTSLTHSNTVNEDAIRKQYAKVSALGADIAVQRAKLRHELRTVLTEETIDKLRAAGKGMTDLDVDRLLLRLAGADSK